MVESRCGLMCSQCSYAQSHGCKGCNSGNPFWGECPVRECCTGKGQNHCGLCEGFVCKQLNDYAYDEEQGDNGKRIENLKVWNNKNL